MFNRQKQTTMNRIRNLLLAVAAVVCLATSAQNSVTDAVYWLDLGYASAKPATSLMSIDIPGLPPGLHSYSMRVKDSEGMWSYVVTRYFIIPRDAEETATNITDREYWIDGKFAARTTLGNSPVAIDIGSLSQGLHLFSLRARDDKGLWSTVVSKYFIIPKPAEEQSEATIDRCRYWFNDSVQNAQFAPLETAVGIIGLDISHLSEGAQHTLYWQVRNSNGVWSKVYSETFTISIAEYLLGDVNDDGIVDVDDMNIVINVILGVDQALNYGHRCYVNDDEIVDVDDMNIIINIILGIYNTPE